MEIVSRSATKNSEVGLNVLIRRKAELKKQIEDQKIIISAKTQILVTPTSLTSYVFRVFSKGLSLVDGFIMGYKIFKSIRSIYRKFKR